MGVFITAAILGLIFGIVAGTLIKDQLNQMEDEFQHELDDDGR